MRSTLIVVTGRSGSGKSTLSHALARRLACPLLSRDELKEGWVHTRGRPHADLGPDANRTVTAIFFETLELLLGRGVTLVAEAAFQHKLWAPALERLAPLADIRIIICSPPAEVAQTRAAARDAADPRRLHFHGAPAAATYDPPRLPFPTREIDTSQASAPDLDALAAFALPPAH